MILFIYNSATDNFCNIEQSVEGDEKYNIYCQHGWDLGTVYGEGSYFHNVFHQFLIKLVINHSINQYSMMGVPKECQ